MSSSSSSPNDAAGGTTPLLNPAEDDRGLRSIRRNSLALFLRTAGNRHLMREPSMLVRESAADELEERQNDWAYSKPVVILDIMWNLAFVLVAAVVLVLSWKESPVMPLRLWILGYVLQCVLHVVCVWVEYRRCRRMWWSMDERIMSAVSLESGTDSSRSEEQEEVLCLHVSVLQVDLQGTSTERRTSGEQHQPLEEEVLRLHPLMSLRSFFFEKICLAIQCHQVKSTLLRETTKFDNKEDVKAFEESAVEDLCILLFNSMFDAKSEEGVAKEDVEQLSKYKFKRIGDGDKLDVETQGPCAGVMVECGTSSPIEYVLSIEDAECCICLSTYDHGAELREMPCGHHFHCTCVDKWLYINATCPLCKYNILKNGNQSFEV